MTDKARILTDKARILKEKLGQSTILIETNILNKVLQDRLDFGFDSIYFRYAELCDELAMYKSIVERTNPIDEKKKMWSQKKHFYDTLEQLVQAHINNKEN